MSTKPTILPREGEKERKKESSIYLWLPHAQHKWFLWSNRSQTMTKKASETTINYWTFPREKRDEKKIFFSPHFHQLTQNLLRHFICLLCTNSQFGRFRENSVWQIFAFIWVCFAKLEHVRTNELASFVFCRRTKCAIFLNLSTNFGRIFVVLPSFPHLCIACAATSGFNVSWASLFLCLRNLAKRSV